MCCGNPDDPGRYDELAAEGRREGLMAKVFTTVPGAVQRIGSYGEASNDEAKALRDEGIECRAIPWLRRADG